MPRRRDDDDRPGRGWAGAGLWAGVGVAAVVVLAGGGAGAWWLLRAKPDPATPAPPAAGPPRLVASYRLKTGLRKVTLLFVSADGRRAAAGTAVVRPESEVWDLGEEPRRVREFAGVVRAVSAGGRLVALEGDPGGIGVVAVDTGAVLSTVPGSAATVACAFAAPGVLATAAVVAGPGAGDTRRVAADRFDTRTGRRLGGFSLPPAGYPAGVMIAGGTELLIAEGGPARVGVWNLGTGARVRGAPLADFPGG